MYLSNSVLNYTNKGQDSINLSLEDSNILP
jgi:hypothetical protein